ncbi:hypothetical protein SIO70_11740 [Chitinophaga sancti]|uniref:hypothetical protein n=1 Tax=Chitinophaga sancti TaxID=1004 RepID=UPI002A74AAF2|nr:hypothetical protein [Chitinophaga sancti]WPQ65520.1 hypothetical protein SIO70_11740 [Chitinophaga sancti]
MENFERTVMNDEVKLYFDLKRSSFGYCNIQASHMGVTSDLLAWKNGQGDWVILNKSLLGSAVKNLDFEIDEILKEIGKR